jgi:dolichol-phosphate mannosyltransferase
LIKIGIAIMPDPTAPQVGPPGPGQPELSLVVPVFNEEESIPVYLDEVRQVLREVTESYEIIFAMDPSTDRTEAMVLEANLADPRVKLLKFTRRFGQPGAIWGGLASSSGRAVIVMDVDLQDPPEVIPELVRIWREGEFKVVIPQRRSRGGEYPVKKYDTCCDICLLYTKFMLIQ